MKFVLFIYSKPQPWAHPTSAHTPEYQALSESSRQILDERFDAVWASMQDTGEIVHAQALASPDNAVSFRWDPEAQSGSPAPGSLHAGSQRSLAGFFVLDTQTQARAQEIAQAFAVPGDDVELRPIDPS